MLSKTTHTAIRMLDSVIDLTEFQVERVNIRIRENRRIGNGIFGLHDALMKMRVPYNSELGFFIVSEIMKEIQKSAEAETIALAEEKGVFPSFEKSIFSNGPPRRNAALLTVAPTGTISFMYDISGGIEPRFALSYHYDKDALAMDKSSILMNAMNDEFRSFIEEYDLTREQKDTIYESILEDNTIYSKKISALLPKNVQQIFACSMDIDPKDHIRMQAVMQQYVDNSISKTINLPENATVEDIFDTYKLCWESGLKGGTLYRDNSRNLQVLRTGVGEKCLTCVE